MTHPAARFGDEESHSRNLCHQKKAGTLGVQQLPVSAGVDDGGGCYTSINGLING